MPKRKKKWTWDEIFRLTAKPEPYFKDVRRGKLTHTIECLGDSVHRIKKVYYDDGATETIEHIGNIRIK